MNCVKIERQTLIEYANGNNVSGSMTSSGKLRNACMSFSKGNVT